ALRTVTIDATGVTLTTACGAVTTRPKHTRKGWKFHTRWRACGAGKRAVLVGTVANDCTGLHGMLRTRKPRRAQRLDPRVGTSNACGGGPSFESTFAGVQSVIFENHGCTQALCHGSAGKQGGLDLSPAVAYQNLLQVPSTESPFPRIEPGDQRRSFLWLK